MKRYQKYIAAFISFFVLVVPALTLAQTGGEPNDYDISFASFASFVLSLIGFFLWIAGLVLDTSIDFFVLQMGTVVNSGFSGVATGNAAAAGGVGTAINAIWTITRDIVNLTFIFGLIYVGIKTILDAQDTNTKKLLTSIIIGALLVNFSLFFSKAIIDVSNLAATEIYNSMTFSQRCTGNGNNANCSDLSLSTTVMAYMGVYDLAVVSDPNAKTVVNNNPGSRNAVFVIAGSVFILIAAFVFAAGAALIAIRFVILVILMALSPIAFAASVLPGISGWAKTWWETLLKQAFFAPAYFFMLYLTLTFSQGFAGSTGNMSALFGGTSFGEDGVNALLFFLVLTIMMIASLVIAKQMGAYGAATATSMSKRLAGGLTFGMAARVGRNTIGSSLYRLKESEKLKEAEKKGGLRGFAARNALRVSNYGAGASFDTRRVAGFGKNTGLGEGKKGGYTQDRKDLIKQETSTAKTLSTDEEQVFKDHSEELHLKWQERNTLREEQKQKHVELSGETDQEKRRIITGEIHDLSKKITDIEDETPGFKEAEKYAKKAGPLEYAANLERRGDNLPLPFKAIYRVFGRTKAENTDGANAIRKETGKGKDDKLLDIFKESTSKKDKEEE